MEGCSELEGWRIILLDLSLLTSTNFHCMFNMNFPQRNPVRRHTARTFCAVVDDCNTPRHWGHLATKTFNCHAAPAFCCVLTLCGLSITAYADDPTPAPPAVTANAEQTHTAPAETADQPSTSDNSQPSDNAADPAQEKPAEPASPSQTANETESPSTENLPSETPAPETPTDDSPDAAPAQPTPPATPQRTPIFDGKSLTGWTNPYEWGKVEVVDGEIHLTAERKFFLVTEKEYHDYEFEGELKLPEGKSNSGFMARGQVMPNLVYGYQAEADPTERRWSGGLYDESRRQWLNPLWKQNEAQAAFDRNRWNRFRIRCVGHHLQFFVNDVPTTDYFDTADLSGRIGLQHHGEKGQTYRFRNLIVRDLGKQQWVPLFNAETNAGETADGEIIPGWKAIGGGTWTVNDGILQGRASIEANEPNGLLYSTREFTNATFRIVYRFKEGDSGFFVRSKTTEANPFIAGVQCEIDGTDEVAGLYQTGGKGWLAKPLHYLEKRFPPDRRDVVRFRWEQARSGVPLADLKTKSPAPDSASNDENKEAPWQTMVVSVDGKRIVTHLNDCLASDLVVNDLAESGVIALQLHGNQNLEIDFRSIEVLQPITP